MDERQIEHWMSVGFLLFSAAVSILTIILLAMTVVWLAQQLF